MHASVRFEIWLPTVTDEALLRRELGRVGRLALALARADDDQLERPVLGAEGSKLGKAIFEALAGRVEIRCLLYTSPSPRD